MYAIFEAKGKQFRATPEMTLRIPSLSAEPGDRVTFDTVLLARASDDADVLVGRPALEGASVAVEVLRHGRDDKIVVYKMKRRKGYRRKQGHRQKFTEVRVVEIDFGTGKPAKAEKKAAKPKAEKKAVEVVDAAQAATAEPDATDAAAELAAEAGIDLADVKGTGEGGRVLKGDVEVAIEQAEAAQIDATPTARELAEEEGIDLATLQGTGKDGRILKSDVEAAIKARDGGE